MYSKLKETKRKVVRRLQWPYYTPPVTRRLLRSRKTSDTLFVLGSGSSICTYNSKMWDHIRTHDSVGFNFWLLHEFVPDFYIGELPIQDDRREIYFKNLRTVKEGYSSCLTMFKTSFIPYYKELSKINGRIALSRWINADDTNNLLKKLPKLVNERHLFPRFYHQTATVDWLIFFSMIAGYEKLILCGVDLNHTEYFFEKQREEVESRGLIIPKSIQSNKIHRTIDATQNKGLLLTEVLDVYHRAGLKKLPKIYIALDSSALHPQLPLYNWPVATLHADVMS